MNKVDITKIFHLMDQNKPPEEISRTLRLAPGCKSKTWDEREWNQSEGCWMKRRCCKIYGCEDSINNNTSCTPWACE